MFKQTIPDFFTNKTIFITGGTGYLGKLLIEKLLRSCSNLKEIIVLIRPKRGKSVDERLEDLRNYIIYQKIRELDSNLLLKIKAVKGDITEDYLGLQLDDLERIKHSVNIVYHMGAAVIFDIDLKPMVEHNVNGVNNMINVVQEIQNLDAFVNVSTMLAVYNVGQYEEKIYPTSVSGAGIMNLATTVNEDILQKITPDLQGDFVNIYAYTKAIGDNLVEEKCKHLPVGIFRPPAVGPIYKEPISGWIDYINVVNGICFGMSNGMIRFLNMDQNTPAFFIPGDYVINCLIAVSWEVAQKTNGITVYNFVENYNITAKMAVDKFTNPKYPLENAFRYPSTSLFPTASEKVYDSVLYTFQTLPAIVWDKIFSIFGLNYKFEKTVEKLNILLKNVAKLHTRNMIFQIENTENLWQRLSEEDKNIFYFDLKSLNWDEYLDVMAYGLKTITLKESMDDIYKAKLIQYGLMCLHYGWRSGFILAIFGSFYIFKSKL